MVIGKDQPLVTDDLTRTATSKNDDRIFKRRFIDIVQLIIGQFQSFLFLLSKVLFCSKRFFLRQPGPNLKL